MGPKPAAVALAALLATAAPAPALVGDTRGPIGVDGSLRTIAAAIRSPRIAGLPAAGRWDALSQTLLRLTALGQPAPWLSYEIHGVQSIDYSSSDAGPGVLPIGLVPGDLRYRPLDATWTSHGGQDPGATFFLDRFNVKLALPHADVTLGRQAITWGKTYFWNPLDVFLAFDPRQFDQEYKPGVDAARVVVPFGPFSGIDVVGAPGRTVLATGRFADTGDDVGASWFGTAVAGRLYTTWHGFDFSLQGGKVYGGTQVGGGLVGEIGPLEVRAEVGWLLAQHGPRIAPRLPGLDVPLVEDGTTAVVGIGHRFASSLTLEAEYFRNGAGDSDALEASLVRFATGGALDLSENLVAAAVTYDILPILIASLGTIVSVDDGSLQIQPRLTWSAADEVEVLAGAIVSRGARPAVGPPLGLALRSEFGAFPDVYYVEVKWYF
jgi:hypothetical protein